MDHHHFHLYHHYHHQMQVVRSKLTGLCFGHLFQLVALFVVVVVIVSNHRTQQKMQARVAAASRLRWSLLWP